MTDAIGFSLPEWYKEKDRAEALYNPGRKLLDMEMHDQDPVDRPEADLLAEVA
jgi:hypothetical protein